MPAVEGIEVVRTTVWDPASSPAASVDVEVLAVDTAEDRWHVVEVELEHRVAVASVPLAEGYRTVDSVCRRSSAAE